MTEDVDAEFAAFVRANQATLHRTAYLLVGQRERAQDVVQTALARVYRAWDRRAAWDSPLAYTRQAVVNVVLTSAQRRWWGEQPTETLPVPVGAGAAPSAPDDVVAARDELRQALLGLPDRQRTAVVFRYYLDLSEAATAAAMQCPTGTVKSMTARGLAALRISLQEVAS